MKIAIFEPYIEGIGGAQKVVFKIGTYLQSKGHEVVIFTQRYNADTAYKEFLDLKIKLIKPSGKNFSAFAFLKKYSGFDVYITNDFPSHFISLRNSPCFWICYSPKRYFYDLKEFYFREANFKGKIVLMIKNLLFKRIDKISARRSRLIMPISKTIEGRVMKYYGLRAPNVFYPGVDFKNYKSGEYGDYILCVSRFEKAKRVDMIIESMKLVNNKRVKLIIVGDGPERENYLKMILRMKNVEILGRVSDSKLEELYSNCLAVAYCPMNEDWGLVPIEAAAAGKLCIGVNEGGLRETIIDGKTGFLISGVTSKKIAEKIDYLMGNKKIAEKMGKAAKVYTKKFEWDYILPEFEKLIMGNKSPFS